MNIDNNRWSLDEWNISNIYMYTTWAVLCLVMNEDTFGGLMMIIIDNIVSLAIVIDIMGGLMMTSDTLTLDSTLDR